MKKILTLAVLSFACAVSARAVIVGASAGYLVDSQTGLYAVRLGHEFKSSTSISHQGEFEIGYSSDSSGPASADLLPLMLNYRGEVPTSNVFSTYFGVGAGVTRVSAKVFGYDDSNWSFSAQGFAGIVYKLNDTAKFTLGARYLWIQDTKIFGRNINVGDDISLELGVGFKF